MSYTLGIPADGQSLGNSKPQVRGNFTSIFNTMAINHVAFNSIGEGKHKFLQMPEQAAGGPSTGTDEGGIYTADKGSFTNLFWKQESGGAIPEKNQGESIQMTNITPSNTATGRSFLPGGMLIQWGKVNLNVGSDTPVVFNAPFDAATVPYTIQLTWAFTISSSLTLSVTTGTATNLGFTIHCNPAIPSGSPPVYYLAIGNRET